jgi:hypothetical protein
MHENNYIIPVVRIRQAANSGGFVVPSRSAPTA